MLPHDLPTWRIVYDDFSQWRRVAAGKRRQPSAGSIDSQSVKTAAKGGAAASTSTTTNHVRALFTSTGNEADRVGPM
jgi:hypothetical protein